jgi:hypothetical protein
MKTPFGRIGGAAPLVALILGVLSIGCEGEPSQRKAATPGAYRSNRAPTEAVTQEVRQTPPGAAPTRSHPSQESEPAPGKAAPAERTSFATLLPATAKKLGPRVYFERIPEGDQRRVYVETTVCLREGEYGLEFLLCRRATKEHESVLHTEADARIIHLGLEAAGATAGSPVQFDPVFKSPTGTPIKITARYLDKGKIITRPAQDWVRNVKTKKALATDWVFAGSIFFMDPEDPNKKPIYLATAEGGYVSVANVPTAMLDLPINSPKQLEGREFAPFTEQIPPVDTKVVLALEPLRKDKKK